MKIVRITSTGRVTTASFCGMRCDGLAPSEARYFAKALNAGRGPVARSAGTHYEVKEDR